MPVSSFSPIPTDKTERAKNKWARQDSNLRPIGYEPTALPLSYEPLERETRLELATTCLEGRDSTN